MNGAWRSYAGRYRRRAAPLAQASALAVLQTMSVAPYVLLVRYIFDTAIPSGEWTRIAGAGVGMAALNAVNAALLYRIRVLALDTTKLVMAEMREELIRKVYSLSRSYLTAAERSRLHSRIVIDSERIDVMSNALVAQFLPALAGAVTLSAIMLWLNWRLFAAILAFFPMVHLLNRWLGPKLKALTQDFRSSFEDFSRGASFVLHSVDLARMQNAEAAECRRQSGIIQAVRHKSRAMAVLDTAYSLAQLNVTSGASIAVLTLGGASVASGSMSMGALLSFYVCAGMLNGYLRTMLSARPQIVSGSESLEAVDEILRSEDTEPYTGSRRLDFHGSIEFRSVTFGYGAADVLRNFSLTIARGDRIALIGANGSGKTTALHLLCGFYRPRGGVLLADGAPYDELDIRALRRSIAVVMQDPILFAGTIHENIAYGDGVASREDVRAAARLATADTFIEAMPAGYDTTVGDAGVLLSGGQRQKISIARALLARPRLLVLDEPTNHLDAASVRRLMRNIGALPDSPTILLVSHDLEVAGEADRIYELVNGDLSLRSDLGRARAVGAGRGERS